MKRLSIRELHVQTGQWVRKAGRSKTPIVITDRGRPVAVLAPYEPVAKRRPLPRRADLVLRLPRVDIDSAAIVSEMRDRS
jgi:prevent-host-death family protein